VKLFDIIPQNLFTVLASPNREVYVSSLFVIRKAFKQEMSIRKDDLVSMLISNMENEILEMEILSDMQSEDEEAIETADSSLSGRAHFIIRRLIETGWIDTEYQMDSFEENITLPEYTVKIINLLHSLTEEQAKEYNSFVYNTYAAIRVADQERDHFMINALFTAYNNTIQLVDELKTLHNNIRRYHQQLNEYIAVNDILRGHFDEYKNLIMDKIYHPLKTMDSVPRFKAPIRKILNSWLADYHLRERMAEQAVLRGKYKSSEEAVEDITIKIGDILDIYEKLDVMLEEIDRKNSAYTRASVEKMQYLLNTDRSIKGKLVELLSKCAPENIKNEDTITLLSDAFNLYSQGYVEEKSLYIRTSRIRDKNEKRMEIREKEKNEQEIIYLRQFIDHVKNSYSHSRVMAYVRSLMGDADVISSREICLENDEDFILLILGALKSAERNVFYRVEFLNGTIDCNGYKIPEMRFINRKGL
jgi:hypothetical protein